jgi:hypothetical protein
VLLGLDCGATKRTQKSKFFQTSPALAIMQSITTAFLDRLEPKALNTMWRFKQNCGAFRRGKQFL